MTAAHTSITGYTTIPHGERVARPRGRRSRSWWQRMLLQRRERRAADDGWTARRAAETAAAPSFVPPRDAFSITHGDDELRRL